MARFSVKFQEGTKPIPVKFGEENEPIPVNLGEVIVVSVLPDEIPIYKGDYVVTPRVTEQTMPTKNKMMTDDVTVNAIPVFRVSNTSGGTTVYIAKEV